MQRNSKRFIAVLTSKLIKTANALSVTGIKSRTESAFADEAPYFFRSSIIAAAVFYSENHKTQNNT